MIPLKELWIDYIDDYKNFTPQANGRSNYVYLIQNHLIPELCKIGITTEPQRRTRELQNQSGMRQDLVAYIECGFEDESAASLEEWLHKHYKSKRTYGEWFILTRYNIDELIMFYGSLSTDVYFCCEEQFDKANNGLYSKDIDDYYENKFKNEDIKEGVIEIISEKEKKEWLLLEQNADDLAKHPFFNKRYIPS